MHQLSQAGALNLSGILSLEGHFLSNPWILLGIAFQIVALVLYLIAISRMDLSYVLPMMTSSYVLTTLMAWLVLGERVAATRWIGTLLISFGVMLAGLTDGKRSTVTKVSQVPQPRQEQG